MDKLKMSTPDLTDKNIEQIGALFPNVITETRDENGAVKKAVDFDLLKQALSKNLVEDDNERYRLDWPGKKASLLKANTPITKTLRPCREESVNFDTTENLYIEGDNFEVLKILQESYLGKIKMICIDPPYNTGNDFIYKDNFAKSKDEYEEELGTTDEEGGRLFRNTDSNGRYHSDRLSMMYERLVVARDLLKDDGVILVSIGDAEFANLTSVMNEIYGEANRIAIFIWKSRAKPTNAGDAKYRPQKVAEYILVYGRCSGDELKFNVVPSKTRIYPHQDDDGKYRTTTILTSNRGTFRRETMRFESGGYTPDDDFRWKAGKQTIDSLFQTNRISFNDDGVPQEKKYEHEEQDPLYPIYCFMEPDLTGTAETGKSDLNEIIGNKHGLDTVKPVLLLKYLITTFSNKNDIILDFFAGSCTTAQALFELNAEQNTNRKIHLVQIPQLINPDSEAFTEGFKSIAEIGKERIRRAGKKIIYELQAKSQQLEIGQEPVDASKLDIGFRVYKTDSTNMKDVFYHPSELTQDKLLFAESNIKDDRTAEDLLTQVILDLGLELTLQIETKKILGNTVFIVQTNALVACFDTDIDFKTCAEQGRSIVDTISDLKPLKVVFKDASFKDDKDRINVEERFKRLSPETRVTVI